MRYTAVLNSRHAERHAAFSLPFAPPRLVPHRQSSLEPEPCWERPYGVDEAVCDTMQPLL